MSTYIDKLPECVNSSDGRIHCSFNQYGADTGRFSSQDPNLQNIPSHNKDIRKMFVATNNEFSVDLLQNSFSIDIWDQIMTKKGWRTANSIKIGDFLSIDTDNGCEYLKVIEIQRIDQKIYFKCDGR